MSDHILYRFLDESKEDDFALPIRQGEGMAPHRDRKAMRVGDVTGEALERLLEGQEGQPGGVQIIDEPLDSPGKSRRVPSQGAGRPKGIGSAVGAEWDSVGKHGEHREVLFDIVMQGTCNAQLVRIMRA
jgi:hypothetical protein